MSRESSTIQEETHIIPRTKENLLNSTVEIHYVDVGLNSAGAYINERKVIERISKRLAEESRVIRFVLHGTPRQWCDSREAVDLESKIVSFGNLGFMWNPLSWVMEAAAIMAIAHAHGGEKILIILILWHHNLASDHSAVSFIEEIMLVMQPALMAGLTQWQMVERGRCFRVGLWWHSQHKLGDIVLADASTRRRSLENDQVVIPQVYSCKSTVHVV
ncbi:hypothetical protein EZV62_027890 [Acer yangbiense]|uniref:Uncharacterized protein n=1 Tax=Acer yangbiense TaxID=1000413 RepID=A0A5C7GP61_9ROSI|nr:hypothetical protein EZV62_027890 [Acer yangbiense]